MKEYKFIHQKLTPIRRDPDFEELLNSYAKMGWRVINVVVHRGILKAIMERELKKEGE